MRKWISNDTVLMAQWAAGRFDTHPMGASIRIPRLVLDSTNDEVSDLIEIHIFYDASKLAYSSLRE
ncbi:hypothetical protein TNCV_4074931, partial [Trichonephila clavipes]